MKKDNIKVCLVGSSGGHLTHLYMLKPFWSTRERFWVTFDKEDARSLLKDEKMYPCYFPTNRKFESIDQKYKNCMEGTEKGTTGSDHFIRSSSICSVLLSGKLVR